MIRRIFLKYVFGPDLLQLEVAELNEENRQLKKLLKLKLKPLQDASGNYVIIDGFQLYIDERFKLKKKEEKKKEEKKKEEKKIPYRDA